MPQSTIFKWKDNGGWIVLCGGGDFTAEGHMLVDGQVLSRTVSNFPLAYIWSDIDAADKHLEQFQDLGGRTGFLLDVREESPESTAQQLEEAGIIVLGDGIYFNEVSKALTGTTLEAIERAFYDGATIYALGRMAEYLATWIPDLVGVQKGLNWVENALVKAPYDPEKHTNTFQQLLAENIPDAYGIGLGTGAAIAFSPQAQVELWGRQAVTVLLGKNLSIQSESES